jgi:hypothetical protein
MLNRMQTNLLKYDDALEGGAVDWEDLRSMSELVWGRFPPDRVYNVDQVPLPFVVGTDTTWDNKGAERVWVRQVSFCDVLLLLLCAFVMCCCCCC